MTYLETDLHDQISGYFGRFKAFQAILSGLRYFYGDKYRYGQLLRTVIEQTVNYV